MSDYVRQVETAVRAAAIHSPTIYSWFGAQSPPLPETVERALTPKTARSYLMYNLQYQLYHDFYCQGVAVPARRDATGPLMTGVTPFVQQLSEANAGSGYWERGWQALAVEDDKVVAGRAGLALWVQPDGYKSTNATPVPGEEVQLRFPKELPSISPGFYMALGDNALTQDDQRNLLRLYWDLDAEDAVRLMRMATLMLNGAQLPFKLKVLNDPDRFTRCDTAVLYIRKNDYTAVCAVLGGIYPQLVGNLKPGIPALTRRLAPGLGLAEDPGRGESYGLHRCALIAEGLLRAHEAGKQDGERLAVVLDCFAEEGISIEKPYLKPGSSDVYDYNFALTTLPPKRGSSHAKRARLEPGGAESFLGTAAELGLYLSQEAVWHAGQCNWLGATLYERGQAGIIYRALSPDLYSGTSGIALFLGELYTATGDGDERRTAVGAMRQALSYAESVPRGSRLGLYTGWVGIALAASRLGLLLGEEEWTDRARQLLTCLVEDLSSHEYDLLSGSAGAIAGLLELGEVLGDGPFRECTAWLGDGLIAAAEKTESWYSWKTPKRNNRNLTGLSHGAAGMGYALLELYHATGNESYRQGAEMAFGYERAHFDPIEGNWPDFREEPGHVSRSKGPRRFAVAWCHGAPGIALSRLRAYQILGDPTYKAEAITALHTTRKMVEVALNSGLENYSLCHGLAGNAEVLLHGGQVLGDECQDEARIALEVANKGIEKYAADPHTWPCGAGGGESPSLMLGLAGIGHFYLRLHDPSIPSVLLV